MKTAENLLRLLGVKSYTQRHIQIINDFLKSGEEEYSSNLWTSPCICPNDEKTGETLCCNICGKPTARTSEELLGDDDAGVIAVNVASNVIPKLTTQEEAFFIAGFQECVKYLRTSPLLASKDARIRELEEANKLAEIKIAELIELNLTPPKN